MNRSFRPAIFMSYAERLAMAATISSLCSLYSANAGIACNALWPATTIATTAVRYAFGESAMQRARKPAIVADAAHEVLCGDARRITGLFLLDEDVLRNAGVRDFDAYQYAPGETLTPDLFVAGR